MSTFFGLELGRRAMAVFKRAIDIASHNISNVKTEGFSRQRAIVTATDPYTLPSLEKPITAGQVGTGSTIKNIIRIFDPSVEFQIRINLSSFSNAAVKEKYLSSLEAIINEPHQESLSSKINDFFNSWQQLSTDAANMTLRSIVREKAILLANKFNYLAQEVDRLKKNIDFEIQSDLAAINNIIVQIKDLNASIRKISATQDNPNDLLDQREKFLKELSEYMDITVKPQENNGIIVYVGGRAIIQDEEYLQLVGVLNPAGFVDIRFSDNLTGPNVLFRDGKIKAMLDLRDSPNDGIVYFENALDNLASAFINTVNSQHQAGWGLDGVSGRNLFVPVVVEPALNMAVDPLVLDPVNGLNVLAASSTSAGIPGNGENARLIALLQVNPTIGSYTFNGYYNNVVSQIGIFSRENANLRENYQSILDNLNTLRESISGVSLDEEATLIIEYQKAFEAIARVIAIYNSVYDTVLSIVD